MSLTPTLHLAQEGALIDKTLIIELFLTSIANKNCLLSMNFSTLGNKFNSKEIAAL
jgi:hypothetical protein